MSKGKVKEKLSKNVVRLSMGIVVLFAVGAVAMTAKFLLFYSSVQGRDSAATNGVMITLNKDLFDSVTQINVQKVMEKDPVSADLRDPFSPPFIPPPEIPEPIEELETPDETEVTPEPEPEPTPE